MLRTIKNMQSDFRGALVDSGSCAVPPSGIGDDAVHVYDAKYLNVAYCLRSIYFRQHLFLVPGAMATQHDWRFPFRFTFGGRSRAKVGQHGTGERRSKNSVYLPTCHTLSRPTTGVLSE